LKEVCGRRKVTFLGARARDAKCEKTKGLHRSFDQGEVASRKIITSVPEQWKYYEPVGGTKETKKIPGGAFHDRHTGGEESGTVQSSV